MGLSPSKKDKIEHCSEELGKLKRIQGTLNDDPDQIDEKRYNQLATELREIIDKLPNMTTDSMLTKLLRWFLQRIGSKEGRESMRQEIREGTEKLKSIQISLSKDPDKNRLKQCAAELGELVKKIESLEQNEGDQSLYDENQMKQHGQKWSVQIMNPTKTEISNAFVNALGQTLNQRVNGIECISDANTVPDDMVPLIVICPKVSRLKPDVDLAIASVRRSTRYVVIILYIGSERNLPVLPSGKSLKGYSNVTFVDMGFNDQGEIFPCEQNRKAESQLMDYFSAFNKRI